MTEKTDIEALLLEMRDLADRIVECQGENSEGEEIIHLYDLSDTTFKAENILLVLGTLEAERQRAEEFRSLLIQSESRAGKYLMQRNCAWKTADEIQAELAELRGEQEPVAWTDAEELRDVEKHGCGYLFKIDPANPYTDPRRQIMVYRRQPRPVVDVVEVMRAVLGPMDASGSRKAVTELLEAAGIVVKDGE